MRTTLWALVAAGAAALPEAVPAACAATVDEAVVYIECAPPQGQPVRGTGVLISAQGHVLTVKHMTSQGYSCKGAVGNATLSLRGPIRDPRRADVDTMLLRFSPSPGERFTWLKFCRLDEALKGRSIVVTGFPGDSTTGQASTRPGALSTTVPDGTGVVESSALTTSEMSGGPVTVEGGASLVGIVAGASFDPSTEAPPATTCSPPASLASLPLLIAQAMQQRPIKRPIPERATSQTLGMRMPAEVTAET